LLPSRKATTCPTVLGPLPIVFFWVALLLLLMLSAWSPPLVIALLFSQMFLFLVFWFPPPLRTQDSRLAPSQPLKPDQELFSPFSYLSSPFFFHTLPQFSYALELPFRPQILFFDGILTAPLLSPPPPKWFMIAVAFSITYFPVLAWLL